METKYEKILEALKKELPYKWKIQTKPKADKKGVCVSYIDARDLQDLLDKTCIWQNEFYECKGKLFCKIGIKTEEHGWIWRSDSGFLENSNIEDGTESKGEVSDTFKRAGIQWGGGRFLYSNKVQYITLQEYNANKFKITEFIQKKISGGYTPKPKNTIAPQEKKTIWFNYDNFMEAIQAGNKTEEEFDNLIKKDGFTLSKKASSAVRTFVDTGEIIKY